MKKFLILLLLQLSLLSVSAGEFDEAYASGNLVFVYFFSSACSTCKNFDSTFSDIMSENKNIKCVKVSIDSKKGLSLFRKYHGLYVPYFILTSSKSRKTVSVPISCAISNMCLERVIKDFN